MRGGDALSVDELGALEHDSRVELDRQKVKIVAWLAFQQARSPHATRPWDLPQMPRMAWTNQEEERTMSTVIRLMLHKRRLERCEANHYRHTHVR